MNNGFYEFSRGKQETTSSVFPYTGSAIISGSLAVTGPASVAANFGYGTSSAALTVNNSTLTEEGGDPLGTGVLGYGYTGVMGTTNDGEGISGVASSGTGVKGVSTDQGIGVKGISSGLGGSGVYATGDTGLSVSGSTTAIDATGPVNISSALEAAALSVSQTNPDGTGNAIYAIGNGSDTVVLIDNILGTSTPTLRVQGGDYGVSISTGDLGIGISANVGLHIGSSGDRSIELPLTSSKVGIQAYSLPGATGDILNFTKDNVETFKVNHLGEVTAPSFTGSLLGTASYAKNAATASNILGGKATHIPFFITDTTLATSSLYQSGSTSVIINQDNNTTANPEALYVWQPHPTSFNVVSGKGNLNNYLQLNIQNTNQGTNASSDIVATAGNGDEGGNYIDMGINSDNFSGDIGGPNDAYLYATGSHLHIGNATPNKPIQFFAGGIDTDTNRKFELNANGQHSMTGSFDISGSLNVRNSLTSSGLLTNGTNTVLGNTVMSGSSTIQGTTTMTGSLLITGSTTQKGNNTLLGNTVLSGSIVISGSVAPGNLSASVNIYGDTALTGFLRFNPYATNVDNSISASYIFVSGSTNDLYFSQNGSGYSNITRLRWIEGNLYTGLLNGGIITSQSSTVYQVSSGSGLIVNLNASYTTNPYPTVTYVNWPTLSASIAPLSSSYDQSFVSIQSNGTIFTQGTPYTDGQFNTLITIGVVVHQNRSTINGIQTFPSVAYGWKQRSSDFIKAFGPIKISGYTLAPSGSSTGSLVLGGGISWVDGRNYIVDPNNPSYINEAVGISTSKIYRYRQSGSAAWVYDTNGGAGYPTIDPANYSNNGTLTPVGVNNWSIQRVFYFPNSGTKALYIYYGNASYGNKADAVAALTTEAFNEAPNTTANAIFVGYMLLRNNADFTTAASYEFRAAGLFRGSGTAVGGGSAAISTLAGLSDTSIVSPTNGQPLVYNSSTLKWENASTLVANLTGTATTASYTVSSSYSNNSTSASYALTASYALNGGGGGSAITVKDEGSTLTTALSSLDFVGSGVTATNIGNAVTITIPGGGGAAFPYTGTAQITGSLVVTSTIQLDGSLTDYASVNSTIVGSNNLYTQATGSYTSAFVKYTVSNGTNARAGEFTTVWNGTNVTYYDNSTTDIGSTSDISFSSAIVTGQIQINTTALTSGWKIKTLSTFI